MIIESRCKALMAGTSKILIAIILGFGHPCGAEQTSHTYDLERLKHLIDKYEELEPKLEVAIKAAETADPNLLRFKKARETMKRWYEDDLGPAKRKWVQWKNQQDNPDKADGVFRRLKGLAGAASFADDLKDPNLAPFMRDTALPILIKGAKDPNMIVGPYTSPNEKDRDKLWEGFKRFKIEESERIRKFLRQYVKEEDIPKWMVQLASDMSRGEFYLMFYRIAIGERTPKEIYDIEKEMKTVARELSRIYPQWNQLRSLPKHQWQEMLEKIHDM